MHALITMDPPSISAAAMTASASTTDAVGGIKKSLSDCLQRVDGKDSNPIVSCFTSSGNKLNDVNKPHNLGGKCLSKWRNFCVLKRWRFSNCFDWN